MQALKSDHRIRRRNVINKTKKKRFFLIFPPHSPLCTSWKTLLIRYLLHCGNSLLCQGVQFHLLFLLFNLIQQRLVSANCIMRHSCSIGQDRMSMKEKWGLRHASLSTHTIRLWYYPECSSFRLSLLAVSLCCGRKSF